MAYDGVNQRFLVAWNDRRSGAYHIYGQLVNADGTLYSTASNVNFVVSNAGNNQDSPSAAYDSVNQRFLVAWWDDRNSATTGPDIYGQLVNADGTLGGGNFAISNAVSVQYFPSVGYDGANGRFLVAWYDMRSGASYDIYAQLVNSDGSLFNTTSNANFAISNAANGQYSPSVGYDSANQRFLVAWWDDRNSATTGTDIYGQLVNADGTLNNTASNENFIISNAVNGRGYPSVAGNGNCGNFLAAYGTLETGVPDIGLSRIGNPCPSDNNKACFIATAAYGSHLADEVKALPRVPGQPAPDERMGPGLCAGVLPVFSPDGRLHRATRIAAFRDTHGFDAGGVRGEASCCGRACPDAGIRRCNGNFSGQEAKARRRPGYHAVPPLLKGKEEKGSELHGP